MMIEWKILFNFYLIFFLEWNVCSDQRQVHAASVSLWLHKKQMAKKEQNGYYIDMQIQCNSLALRKYSVAIAA